MGVPGVGTWPLPIGAEGAALEPGEPRRAPRRPRRRPSGPAGPWLDEERPPPPDRDAPVAVAGLRHAGPPRPPDDPAGAALDIQGLAGRLPAEDARLVVGRLMALQVAAGRPRPAAPAQLRRHRRGRRAGPLLQLHRLRRRDRKSTRLNSSHAN